MNNEELVNEIQAGHNVTENTEAKALKSLKRNDIIKAFKPFYTSPKKIQYKNYYGTGYESFKNNYGSSTELFLDRLLANMAI